MRDINISRSKEILKNDLTFYHECLIPKNDFFLGPGNKNRQEKFLVVSSPSRMGNHALMSLLDSHPSLPRVPGEDSFLRHSFFQCSDDLYSYRKNLMSDNNALFMANLSSFPATVDKWAEVKKAYASQDAPKLYAGVQYPTDRLVVTDYQDTLLDINHEAYVGELQSRSDAVAGADNFSDVFMIYLKALMKLDFNPAQSAYLGIYANSGMRRQCLWLCENFPNVRIVSSIRAFDSYAISHIRSRNKVLDFKEEYLQEAWEHWYHKVIDYLYLKINFPAQIQLVLFDDLSKNTDKVAETLCQFLGIPMHDNLMTATIMGVKTKGNSSKAKSETQRGKFYSSLEVLPREYVPERVFNIESAIEALAY